MKPILNFAFYFRPWLVLRALVFAGLLVLGRQAAYAGSYTNTFDSTVGAGDPGGSATCVVEAEPAVGGAAPAHARPTTSKARGATR